MNNLKKWIENNKFLICIFLLATVFLIFSYYFYSFLKNYNQTVDKGFKDTLFKFAIAVFPVISLVLGGAGKYLHEKYSDENESIPSILTKLIDKKPLSTKQKSRLSEEARLALIGWAQAMNVKDKIIIASVKYHKNLRLIKMPTNIKLTESSKLQPEPNRFDLYITLDDNAELNNLDQIRQMVNEKFITLDSAGDNITSRLIKNSYKNKEQTPIIVVIKLYNYRIKGKNDLFTLRKKLAEVLDTWLPLNQLILETFISDDIDEEGDSDTATYTIADRQDTLSDITIPVANYVFHRNAAYRYINKGHVLGVLKTPPKEIPPSIVSIRLEQFANTIPKSWTCSFIHGGPGTGKTDLAKAFVEDWLNKHNDIVINISTPNLVKLVSNISGHPFSGSFWPAFIYALSLDLSARIEQQFDKDAYFDCLLSALVGNRKKILLVIDDLDSSQHIIDSILANLGKMSSWGIKVLAIGRSKPENNQFVFYECHKWNLNEAMEILRCWGTPSNTAQLQQRFDNYYQVDESKFSSYLLRIISLAAPQDKNETLFNKLKSQLIELLYPFNSILTNATRTADEKLDIVLRALSRGYSGEAVIDMLKDDTGIEPIEFFSRLAWGSRFNTQNIFGIFITPATIQQYGNLSMSASIKCYNDCFTYEILKGTAEGALLQDNWIADGCVAIDLKEGINGNEDIKISIEKLRKLRAKNSMEMFQLIVDITTIGKILKTYAESDTSQIDEEIIGELITTDYVLRQPIELREKLLLALWATANKTSIERRYPLIICLSKFYSITESLRSLCTGMIVNNNIDSDTALMVNAYVEEGNKDYFGKFASQISIPDIFDAAARMWGGNFGNTLISELFERFNRSYSEKLKNSWIVWCLRQNFDANALAFVHMLKLIRLEFNQQNFNYIFWADVVDRTLAVIKEKSRVESKQTHYKNYFKLSIVPLLIELTNTACHEKNEENKLRYANFLVKPLVWMAAYYSEDCVDFKLPYIVDLNKRRLIPQSPFYNTRKVSSIFNTLRDSENMFELNSSTLHPPVDTEVLKDGFPEAYDYNLAGVRLQPTDFKVWTNGQLGFITREILEGNLERKFLWRPVFKIPQTA